MPSCCNNLRSCSVVGALQRFEGPSTPGLPACHACPKRKRRIQQSVGPQRVTHSTLHLGTLRRKNPAFVGTIFRISDRTIPATVTQHMHAGQGVGAPPRHQRRRSGHLQLICAHHNGTVPLAVAAAACRARPRASATPRPPDGLRTGAYYIRCAAVIGIYIECIAQLNCSINTLNIRPRKSDFLCL